jgi:hypothetical protein
LPYWLWVANLKKSYLKYLPSFPLGGVVSAVQGLLKNEFFKYHGNLLLAIPRIS